MAFLLEDVKTRVDALLQDDKKFIVGDERDQAISQAILQVTLDKPFEKVVDITGDATGDYDIESEGWQKGFSDAKQVEVPADENPPVFIDRGDDWFIYENPSKTAGEQIRLRFVSLTPAATETIRFTFTQEHTVTKTTTTLNTITFAAVIAQALVIMYRALAGKFAQTADPTIEADAVDYGGRSQNFLFLAERWNTAYKATIGTGEGAVPAAQAIGEADVVFPHGEDFLFHPARQR